MDALIATIADADVSEYELTRRSMQSDSTDSDYDMTHDDEQVVKPSRGKGNSYIHHQWFESLAEAQLVLQDEYLEARWRKLNTFNNVCWYQCKGKDCEMRCKLIVSKDEDDTKVALHINVDFLSKHAHSEEEAIGHGLPARSQL